MKKSIYLIAGLFLPALSIHAEKGTVVEMFHVNKNGTGQSIGEITISSSKTGIMLTPNLKDLEPGLHGFHVHEIGSCSPGKKDDEIIPAGAAGSHLDLQNAEHHGTPWGEGHMGDLPALFVDDDGKATHPVFAPRLTNEDIKGKALIIHEGGDNYSDEPEPLGGGGARVACGIIGGESSEIGRKSSEQKR